MSRYLTKSRFKLALECESKLYYTRKPEYADRSTDDPFLLELAKGGYQVGELAKYYFTDNAREITVREMQAEAAVNETGRRIDRGDRYIAEAAIRSGRYFIRVDIFEINKAKKEISLFEVKSKSWTKDDVFLKTSLRGANAGQAKSEPEWKPYLMDIAFQKYVTSLAYPDYTVKAFLMLVNKDAKASVDGLNQLFKVRGERNSYEIVVDPGLTRAQLGDEVLIRINVDDEVEFIHNSKLDSLLFPGYSFREYLEVLAKAYDKDEKLNTPLSKVCKSCQFYTKPGDPATLKSGLEECWCEKLHISEKQFKQPKVIDLWGGKAGFRSIIQGLMDKGSYFLSTVEPGDIGDNILAAPDGELTPVQRRWEQVRRVKEGDSGFYIDSAGLKEEMDTWTFPLHFIDFETASPALPFTKDAHPYEGVAFQYSHHTVEKGNDGSYRIKHKNQFLMTEPGVNPNIDFIRELKRDLEEDEGTIFRYHNHENTYLRFIYNQLSGLPDTRLPDKNSLLSFIDSITQHGEAKNKIKGPRNMVDMYDLVLRFYFSSHAGGSNSLKKILPAAINDSKLLKVKYSQPVCGREREVSSLNFDSKVWIDPAFNNDPYKTLPKIFEDFSREELDEAFSGFEEVADGGAAMMAYAKLQFFNTSPEQRTAIRNGLLKYCELDTLAMVMLWEFWTEMVQEDG